ncbi:hypothetical protein DQT32_04840 [Salmonella enterica subsp. enterica serovar Braenderup]|nr:hypothetical protein [Salmonella enterica subsp. enterica serovar Braenderup]
MFFKQKFKIFFDNGKIEEVDDLLEYIGYKYGAVENFYSRMKFSVKVKKESFWYANSSLCSQYDWVVQDFYLYTSNNVMISPDLFRNEYKKYRRERNYYIIYRNKGYTKKQWEHKRFRKGYTTTYTRDFDNFTARRAAASVVKEEGEPEFRGKRRHLPDVWEEKMSRRSLSWKECTKRKRQYKGS